MRISSDDWIVRTDTGGVLATEVAGLVAADETGGLGGRGRATRKASVEVHNALHAGGILGGTDSLKNVSYEGEKRLGLNDVDGSHENDFGAGRVRTGCAKSKMTADG